MKRRRFPVAMHTQSKMLGVSVPDTLSAVRVPKRSQFGASTPRAFLQLQSIS